MAAVKALVAGASGFVGSRLCPALAEAGHDVVAMTRNPAGYAGAGTPVYGDVHDRATLGTAMAGCQAAYYLVHSLSEADFERKDAAAAVAFGEAGARARLQQIIYLGGLGDDTDALSAHLRSRREVEKLLAAAGVPVTVIRAGIIIGHGGISWELTRQLVEHLPAMITPRWVATRTQPIAADDIVRYLLGVLALPQAEGLVFGGRTPTLTDSAVATGRADLGDAALIGRHRPLLEEAARRTDVMLADAIDRVKTAKGDRALVAVGGGSILVPDGIPGVSEVIRPDHFDAANAIGAAIASVSGQVDRIFHLSAGGRAAVLDEASGEAREHAVAAGADPDTVQIVEIEEIPLAYLTTPAVRIRVKAAGTLGGLQGQPPQGRPGRQSHPAGS